MAPGPGPQPPAAGPFFLTMTVTARSVQDTDSLYDVFAEQRAGALQEGGATAFLVGRGIGANQHTITIFEQYDDISAFHRVHSPEFKDEKYFESRRMVMALKESMHVEFFQIRWSGL
ncbi:hypothetical protein EDD37DRAFT_649277 [Exophiala viscosa]|uniref:uncharacterized protein n=1 Tax=Exophiala viscosa TaxID=2486360 RepID=UPI00218DA0DA|nr:hypothetical protein EDD37DRAFT_649277 [Exophiala viscosa]